MNMNMYDVAGLERIDEGFTNEKEMMGLYLIDEVARMSDDERKTFMESDEYKTLDEARAFAKPQMIRLSKDSDLKRREKLEAFTLAREAKDPLWTKLVKNRVVEKQLIAKIMQKYGPKAKRAAMVHQKTYVKGYGKAVASGKSGKK